MGRGDEREARCGHLEVDRPRRRLRGHGRGAGVDDRGLGADPRGECEDGGHIGAHRPHIGPEGLHGDRGGRGRGPGARVHGAEGRDGAHDLRGHRGLLEGQGERAPEVEGRQELLHRPLLHHPRGAHPAQRPHLLLPLVLRCGAHRHAGLHGRVRGPRPQRHRGDALELDREGQAQGGHPQQQLAVLLPCLQDARQLGRPAEFGVSAGQSGRKLGRNSRFISCGACLDR
mmetsp:Transcript_72628/g.203939  ORF Transcript_72628/g.203939 Transcript_72628/m.203939 type:complete len:229 (+) Transcript_72628:408-1094(+)